MKEKITVVGHVAYDYIFSVEKHPSMDSSTYIKNWKKCYGGGAANISVGLASLGKKSILYTMAGKDFKRYENYLKKRSVEVRAGRSKKRMARAFIFNDSRGQKTYFFWGASEDMEKMKGIKSKYLHIAPCHPLLALKMAEKAEFFAFEPGQDIKKYDESILSHIIEKANIIFCNETEIRQMEKMVHLKGKNVIITLGGRGSRIYGKGIRIPAAKPRRMADATGAGDAYKAGFWYSFLEGNDIEECCKYGSTLASFVVEKVGAQNFPSFEEFMERYERNFG